MRIRRYPFFFAALAGAVAPAMLTAGPERSAATAVAYAATRTLDVGSSRIEITYDLPPAALPAPLALPKATGLIDYRNHRGRIAYGSPESEMVFDGDVTYDRVGEWAPADKQWVRFTDGHAQTDPFNVEQRAMFDPSHVLALLRRTSNGVHEVGTEDVRGFPTTHYEGVLNLQKIVDEAPSDERADLQFELDFLSKFQPKTIPYGIWVDSDDIARRLRLDQPEGAAITLEFYDFGVPVVLDLPSPDEVMGPDEFFALMDKYANDHTSDCKGDSADTSEEQTEEPMVWVCTEGFSVISGDDEGNGGG